MKSLPTFIYEKHIWKREYRYIAGIDEVGRGCFAGPVVASAVVFAKDSKLGEGKGGSRVKPGMTTLRIDDSKKLSAKQREAAAIWIKENCLAWGIGEASASIINRVGIVPATQVAFRRAIAQASERLNKHNYRDSRLRGNDRRIDYLLIDAFYIPYVKGLRRKNQKAIIKGDSKSISIAAASILAKVYRDELMEKIGKRSRYKKYDWGSNKGYGTKVHLEAIVKHGVNGYHRQQFVNTYLNKFK
jgi:ribonuclease HII